MKSIFLQDINKTINVEYVTDLISPTAENFTVMSIKGLTDLDRHVGINFKKIAYNLSSIKTFAQQNFLKVILVDYSGVGTSTTLVDYTPQSSGGGFPLGIDNM